MNFVSTTSSATRNFDEICSKEIYPAIVKAFGCLQYDTQRNNALLYVAAEHLSECVRELCIECRDTYMTAEPKPEAVSDLQNYLRTRGTAAKAD